MSYLDAEQLKTIKDVILGIEEQIKSELEMSNYHLEKFRDHEKNIVMKREEILILKALRDK